MINMKNSNCQICYSRIPYIDVDISGKYENMKKFVKYIHQQFYKTTMIPKNMLKNN